MPIFAVHYDYDNRSELRMATRPAHRDFLADLAGQGIMLLRGAYIDEGAAGALLVVKADDAEQAGALLDADPYLAQGVIAERRIREWGLVGDHPFG